jgi:hypothetical protein
MLRLLLVVCLAVPLAGQKITIEPAEFLYFPGIADSNSPIHWSSGKMFAFNSDGQPVQSQGEGLGKLRYARAVQTDNLASMPWWIEATYKAPDGALYAWYHHEVMTICGGWGQLSAPVVGAAVSYNNGHSFTDLGIVLRSGERPDCSARNGYFAGGHGDFSVILDQKGEYFYFLFSVYDGPAERQGVAVARMAAEHLAQPQGNAWKYSNGAWMEPGLGGRVTPIFHVQQPWGAADTDAFWGPSVHFNRELGEYVVLLNRACCEPGWPSEGIYVTTNPDLANPAGWSAPAKIIDGGGWYPMAVGLGPGDTDKSAGARARLFLGSDSEWELVFRRGAAAEGKPITPIRASSPSGSSRLRRQRDRAPDSQTAPTGR